MFSLKKLCASIVTIAIASASFISLCHRTVSADITGDDVTLSPGNKEYVDLGYDVPLPVTRFGKTPCIDLYISNGGYISSLYVKYSENLDYSSFTEISQKGILWGSSSNNGVIHRRIGSDDLKEEYFDEDGYLIPGYYNIQFSTGSDNCSFFYYLTGNEEDGIYDGSYNASIQITPGTKTDNGYVFGFAEEFTAELTGYDDEADWSIYYVESSYSTNRTLLASIKTTFSKLRLTANILPLEYFDSYGCLIPGSYIVECKDSNSTVIASETMIITQEITDGSYDRYKSALIEIMVGNNVAISTPSGNTTIKSIGTASSIKAQIYGYSGDLTWNLSYMPSRSDNDYQWDSSDVLLELGIQTAQPTFPASVTTNYDPTTKSYIPGMYMISATDPHGFTIASSMIRITGSASDGTYPPPVPTQPTTPQPQPETPTIETTPPAQTPAVTPVVTPAVTNPTPSANASESGTAGFVERLYTIALGRNSEPTGKANWIKALQTGSTGAEAAKGFLFSDEFLNKSMSDRAFVTTLYRTFFDREPDAAGLTAWINALKNGTSKEDVIMGFIDSTEWANVCLKYGIPSGGNGVANITVEPNENIVAFATRLYTTCMKRNPDQSGLMAWARQLANLKDTGTNAAHGFFFSDEFLAQDISDSEFVTRLYLTFMGRNPDYGGKKAWVEQLQAGVSREEVFQGFAQSDEFGNICAQYGIIR